MSQPDLPDVQRPVYIVVECADSVDQAYFKTRRVMYVYDQSSTSGLPELHETKPPVAGAGPYNNYFEAFPQRPGKIGEAVTAQIKGLATVPEDKFGTIDYSPLNRFYRLQ